MVGLDAPLVTRHLLLLFNVRLYSHQASLLLDNVIHMLKVLSLFLCNACEFSLFKKEASLEFNFQ